MKTNDIDGRIMFDKQYQPNEKQLADFWKLRWELWKILQWSLEWDLSAKKTLSVHKKEYQDAAVEAMIAIEAVRPLWRDDDEWTVEVHSTDDNGGLYSQILRMKNDANNK